MLFLMKKILYWLEKYEMDGQTITRRKDQTLGERAVMEVSMENSGATGNQSSSRL
jgi:hypothetical protein